MSAWKDALQVGAAAHGGRAARPGHGLGLLARAALAPLRACSRSSARPAVLVAATVAARAARAGPGVLAGRACTAASGASPAFPDLLNILQGAACSACWRSSLGLFLYNRLDRAAHGAGAVSVRADRAARRAAAALSRLEGPRAARRDRQGRDARADPRRRARRRSAGARPAPRRRATSRSASSTTRRACAAAQLQGVPVLGAIDDVERDRARDRGAAAGHRDAVARRRADAARGRRSANAPACRSARCRAWTTCSKAARCRAN